MIAYRYFKRKKRTNDLWNLRIKGSDIFADICDEGNGLSEMRKDVDMNAYNGFERKKIVEQFLKLLSDHQAKSLKNTVEEKGASYGACLMLPCYMTVKVSKAHSEICPLLLSCQVWRWNDLEDTKELSRLSYICSGSPSRGPRDEMVTTSPTPEDANHHHHRPFGGYRKMECCNPYHWARETTVHAFGSSEENRMVQKEKSLLALLPSPCDTTSPDELSDEVLIKTDAAPTCSTETGISCVYGGQPSVDSGSFDSVVEQLPGGAYANPSSRRIGRHHWCVLQYWEENVHIGANFKVVDPVFNVLYGTPSPLQEGLRLDQFENKKVSKKMERLLPEEKNLLLMKEEKIERLRRSIGLGFCLILDDCRRQVRIYNRGNLPLFVSSECLISRCNEEEVQAFKVKPGYALTAFDLDFRPPVGVINVPNSPCSSIYVSFGKGWGPGYKRRKVLDCSCWIEICLASSI